MQGRREWEKKVYMTEPETQRQNSHSSFCNTAFLLNIDFVVLLQEMIGYLLFTSFFTFAYMYAEVKNGVFAFAYMYAKPKNAVFMFADLYAEPETVFFELSYTYDRQNRHF